MESLIVLLFTYLFEVLSPVFNFLLEFLLRILLQIIFEIIFTPVAYFFERVFSKFQAHLALKIFASAAIGALLGRLSIEFLPQLAIADIWLRLANMLATPLASAALIVLLKFFMDNERNSYKLAGSFARAYTLIFFLLFSRAYFGLSMPVESPRAPTPPASVQAPLPARLSLDRNDSNEALFDLPGQSPPIHAPSITQTAAPIFHGAESAASPNQSPQKPNDPAAPAQAPHQGSDAGNILPPTSPTP